MIIFDLDGTLADCEHRRHFVDSSIPHPTKKEAEEFMRNGCTWKPDWKAFYEACDKDEPIESVCRIFINLIGNRENIEIWSGRCESVRSKTCDWICNNIFNTDQLNPSSMLKMRPIGDNTPDDQLKERWLDEYLNQFVPRLGQNEVQASNHIDFVFDDRPKVVRMWRRRGIFVFDVNQNGKEF